ncbi:MAG: RNA methyltransferase [Mesoaciditoga sp.]|uniref:THUMP domain-containing class I SAM-dependent RNA methyltransferase n=1 Tax=Athalassotoga sp. TaxID=2022597 RepID=UPI000CA8E0C1|nr:MAG: RNA methyltransferase [Mesoaciditoga sp.]PMP80494.1 MAG: RNA methyltransferase [Mesoaciditoga sp.]
MKDTFTIMIPTAFGIEGVTKKELKKLGYDAKAQDGRVNFEGGFKDIVRANLWIRTGNRVMIKMAEFDAYDFDTLFDRTFKVEWAEFLTKDANFPVELSSVKSKLSSVPACQSIVKKAIVEKLKKRYGINQFPEDGPLYRIKVQILKDHVIIGLDTTGYSLNKRGYRVNISEAPLKETLAASLVLLSNWNGEPLWDGFCGSGTIPIEGAMIAKNIAPGLIRDFAFESWKNFPVSILYEEKRIAKESIKKSAIKIIGTDIDKKSIDAAIKNAKRIGLEKFIEFRTANIKDFVPRLENGYFISNLPYGKRLEKSEELYQILKEKYMNLRKWNFFFLTADSDFERKFFKADENRKMFNGRIEVRFYMYKRRNEN